MTTKKASLASFYLHLLLHYGSSFQPPIQPKLRYYPHSPLGKTLNVISGDDENVLDKVQRVFQDAPPFDPQFDSVVTTIFPSAVNNNDLEYRVVSALAERGFTSTNTLLATSLCSDELAKRLGDDFVKIYGSNFNLGGLAGFPFAGNIGFQTMSGHIPDDGFCFIVFGPHVGLTRDGEIGYVERKGVSENDICCRSAIEASNCVMGYSQGVEQNNLMDLQQGAVQNLMLPLSDRLLASDYPMLELPYAIYDTQNQLVEEIIGEGIAGIKGGIALLGGVQINTSPDTLDYFHPLRFDLINNQGELVEDMLSKIANGRGWL